MHAMQNTENRILAAEGTFFLVALSHWGVTVLATRLPAIDFTPGE
jgi:hypothetical protein